ncbi:MAG: transporter [Caldimonas sp.]
MTRAAVVPNRAIGLALALASLLADTHALAGDELLLNPFGDPFVRATVGRPCPTPLGPAYTEATRRIESHSRAERGTTCWLAGRCSEPNAYRYDVPNAIAALAALQRDLSFADSAVWVTAQRRFLYLEGCVADPAQAQRMEALLQALPEVDRVIPALALPGEKPPYATAGSARRPR